MPYALACCGDDYSCVKRSDSFSQCRKVDEPGLLKWDGAILKCGDPTSGPTGTVTDVKETHKPADSSVAEVESVASASASASAISGGKDW